MNNKYKFIRDSNQLTIEMSTNDFNNTFTYDEDEPDITWLINHYNIDIDKHDHVTYITGNKQNLSKLFTDHHLKDILFK